METVSPQGRATGARRSIWELDLMGRVWHFFTSVRLALVLILLITAAVLAGTLLDQVPPSVRADSAMYGQWLDRAEGKYGIWTNVFKTFDLFNVFHTLWFKLLVGLLVINIIVCTLNRWKGIWRMVFPPRIRMTDAFYEHARFNASYATSAPSADLVKTVRHAFKKQHYRVSAETNEDSVAIYADKHRFSRFGTFVSHLALVLILAGTVVGGIWGFSDPEFIVAEGSTRDVGLGTGLSVYLEQFTEEYDVAGPPKDFHSEIIVYKNGEEVKRGITRVNSPLSYGGVRFFQSFFGQTAVMQVSDETGQSLFNSPVALAWQTREGNRPVGTFNIPARGLEVYVIGPRSGDVDPLVPAGEMRVEVYQRDSGTLVSADNLAQGTAQTIGGVDFTFVREGRFTGLSVSKDPGVNIVWIASALMVIGLVMLFYFPHRRLWASCKAKPDGTSEVRIAMTGQRDMQLEKEFDQLKRRLHIEVRKLNTRGKGG